jgi:hypothetical protein
MESGDVVINILDIGTDYQKMIAFWDIAPCSLVVVDRRFGGDYYLPHQGDE